MLKIPAFGNIQTVLRVRSVLQQIHWLNIDVAAGAALCATAASKLPDGHGEVNFWAIGMLTLCVWLIYTVDRLLDIRRKPSLPTPRHQFHAQHSDLLWKISVGVAIVLAGLSFLLPYTLIRLGIILTAVVGLYLFAVNKLLPKSRWLLLKEPITACVYTAGIWGVAFANRPDIPWQHQVMCLMFGLLAFQNLLLFSHLETKDRKFLPVNLASILKENVGNRLTYLIGAAIVLLFLWISVTDLVPYQRRFAFTELLMSVVLWELWNDSPYYLKNERYRWIGDGVFLLAFWLL